MRPSTDGLLQNDAFSLLVPILIEIWFVLIPPGHRGPPLDLDRLSLNLVNELKVLLQPGTGDQFPDLAHTVADGSQPTLTMMMMGTMLEIVSEHAEELDLPDSARLVMALAIKAAVTELDRACREWDRE